MERVEEIEKVDKTKWNKSVYFILPMIGISSNYRNLINCYLGDSKYPKYNYNKILVELKFKDNYILKNEYLTEYYETEKNTVIYVFDVPDKFEKDFFLFLTGKYSKFSDNYKKHILSFIQIRPVQNSYVYKILYKTTDLKLKVEESIGQELPDDAEICSIADWSKEIREEM